MFSRSGTYSWAQSGGALLLRIDSVDVFQPFESMATAPKIPEKEKAPSWLYTGSTSVDIQMQKQNSSFAKEIFYSQTITSFTT